MQGSDEKGSKYSTSYLDIHRSARCGNGSSITKSHKEMDRLLNPLDPSKTGTTKPINIGQ